MMQLRKPLNARLKTVTDGLIEKQGRKSRQRVWEEESAELSVALCHLFRSDKDATLDDVAKEVADCLLALDGIQEALHIRHKVQQKLEEVVAGWEEELGL